jgi:methyltransferase
MLSDLLAYIGPPQIGALLVLAQRGLEDLYSDYNTRRLLAAGAVEKHRPYYRVIVAAHMSWLAAVFFLMPADAPVLALPLAIYLVLQPVRYWAIATLGPYWTHSIVTLEGAPLVRSGLYRYFAHPIYAIAITEIMLLPMIFGGWVLGLVIGALYAPILAYKIVLENRALVPRQSLT